MALIKIPKALFLCRNVFPTLQFNLEKLHTAAVLRSQDSLHKTHSGKWLSYNEKIFEPQSPDESPRPAVRNIPLFVVWIVTLDNFSMFAINV